MSAVNQIPERVPVESIYAELELEQRKGLAEDVNELFLSNAPNLLTIFQRLSEPSLRTLLAQEHLDELVVQRANLQLGELEVKRLEQASSELQSQLDESGKQLQGMKKDIEECEKHQERIRAIQAKRDEIAAKRRQIEEMGRALADSDARVQSLSNYVMRAAQIGAGLFAIYQFFGGEQLMERVQQAVNPGEAVRVARVEKAKTFQVVAKEFL